jgi:hypothetical protein
MGGRSGWLAPCAGARVILAALAVSACGFGSGSLDSVDPGSIPDQPDYATDIAPILTHYCTNCHSQHAPAWSQAGPFFDRQSEAEGWACVSWLTIADGSMPPGALDRLTTREQAIFQRWSGQVSCVAHPDR